MDSNPGVGLASHFLFVGEATYKAQAETGEVKGHYLNATAGTSEGMMFRAEVARDLGHTNRLHSLLRRACDRLGHTPTPTELGMGCSVHRCLLRPLDQGTLSHLKMSSPVSKTAFSVPAAQNGFNRFYTEVISECFYTSGPTC